MIFVAVGTQFSFNRLIQYMDEWAAQHDEEVIAQISDGDFIPEHKIWWAVNHKPVIRGTDEAPHNQFH